MQTTPAGGVFVQHARYALEMQDRAVHLSREAFLQEKNVLLLGKSPYTDPFFMTALAAIQKSVFPDLRLDVQSNFTPELSRQLVAGVLDLAVMAEGPHDAQISTLTLDESPFYALLQDKHPAAR